MAKPKQDPLQAKLDALILQYEEDLESENYHSMIGVHQRIADSVTKHAGVKAAIAVLQDIGSLMC